MNQVGMGIIYTNTHDLRPLRKNQNKDILKYYNEWHNKLNEVIRNKLKSHGEVLFIDLHSYSKEPLDYELNKHLNRPEISIGVNNRYNKKVLENLIYIVKEFDFSYRINEPFSGSLVPSDYINDERVHSIMIEIRKDVYDNDLKFEKIKKFFKKINSFL